MATKKKAKTYPIVNHDETTFAVNDVIVPYGRSHTGATHISATVAARQFSDLINRAHYRDETFVIERGGKEMCELIPASPSRFTAKDFRDLLSTLPRADEEYLDKVEEVIANRPPVEASPWDK